MSHFSMNFERRNEVIFVVEDFTIARKIVKTYLSTSLNREGSERLAYCPKRSRHWQVIYEGVHNVSSLVHAPVIDEIGAT